VNGLTHLNCWTEFLPEPAERVIDAGHLVRVEQWDDVATGHAVEVDRLGADAKHLRAAETGDRTAHRNAAIDRTILGVERGRFEATVGWTARSTARLFRVQWTRPLIAIRHGRLAVIFQAPDHVGRQIPRQHVGGVGLVAAFAPQVLHHTAPFGCQRSSPDPSHRHRQAIGFETNLVCLAGLVRRRAGDAGNPGHDIAQLTAQAARRFDRRHRQAIGLRPVLGFQQHPVNGQFVEIVILFPPAICTRECDNMRGVGRVVEREGEIGPALFALEEGDGPAGEIAARDFGDGALAGHRHEDIGIRVRRFGLFRDQNDGA
jgi:hypothetical protein